MSYIPTGAARNYIARPPVQTTKGLTVLSTTTMASLTGPIVLLGVAIRTTTTITGGACAVSIDFTIGATTTNVPVMYHDGANTVWSLSMVPLVKNGTGSTAGDTLWYPIGIPAESNVTVSATTSGTAAGAGAIEVITYYANVV